MKYVYQSNGTKIVRCTHTGNTFHLFRSPSFLSNFSECNINFNGKHYSCNEQLIMANRFPMGHLSKQKIMEMSEPHKMKNEGRKANLDLPRDIRNATYGMWEKYTQNPAFRESLLGTHNDVLVEGTHNKVWGVGTDITKDENVVWRNSSKWEGQYGVGVLGVITMVIREDLKNNCQVPSWNLIKSLLIPQCPQMNLTETEISEVPLPIHKEPIPFTQPIHTINGSVAHMLDQNKSSNEVPSELGATMPNSSEHTHTFRPPTSNNQDEPARHSNHTDMPTTNTSTYSQVLQQPIVKNSPVALKDIKFSPSSIPKLEKFMFNLRRGPAHCRALQRAHFRPQSHSSTYGIDLPHLRSEYISGQTPTVMPNGYNRPHMPTVTCPEDQGVTEKKKYPVYLDLHQLITFWSIFPEWIPSVRHCPLINPQSFLVNPYNHQHHYSPQNITNHGLQ